MMQDHYVWGAACKLVVSCDSRLRPSRVTRLECVTCAIHMCNTHIQFVLLPISKLKNFVYFLMLDPNIGVCKGKSSYDTVRSLSSFEFVYLLSLKK